MTDGPKRNVDLFVSYSSQDRRRVLAIVEDLEASGLEVWVDRRKIEGGADWSTEIVHGVKACRVFVLMCSGASMRSRNVKQEIQLAWKYEKPYLPLLLELIDYPEQVQYFLEGWHWIEVLQQSRERWLPQVLSALAQAGVGGSSCETEAASPVDPTHAGYGLEGLRALARFTDQIWPLPADRAARYSGATALRDLGAPQDDVQHKYRIGSRLALAIESERAGHLLLLNEGTSGKIYCLCPSWFAPDSRVQAGRSYLPQRASRYTSFEVTGVPGREQLLAIITDEPLGLEWLPVDPKVPARVLGPQDVELLLERLRSLEGDRWTALSTYFDVSA